MVKKYKKLWIKALLSGKYKQSKGMLWGKNGYCCLGVICKIHPKIKWTKSTIDGVNRACYKDKVRSDIVFLPLDLRKALKIKRDEETYLARMNDNSESFDKIAQFIEVNL